MMSEDKEVLALLRLIDDPDAEVYQTVTDKILGYGKAIIPKLESLWEVTEDQEVQSRIETLIHRVHFQDLEANFHEWASEKNPGLLRGAILVARIQYPDLNPAGILSQVDNIRRNIWLELNPYLTPLEQVNVFNSILFSYFKLEGHELGEREPRHFYINQMFENRQGNGFSIGILYLVLCELLDVPIFAVDIPRQLVFAYISSHHPFQPAKPGEIPQIAFFIDPMNGSIYTRNDVDAYLKKIGATEVERYMQTLNSHKIIYKMMEELALCYRYLKQEEKADEIQLLMRLIQKNDETEM